jgi:hypothetical protein
MALFTYVLEFRPIDKISTGLYQYRNRISSDDRGDDRQYLTLQHPHQICLDSTLDHNITLDLPIHYTLLI